MNKKRWKANYHGVLVIREAMAEELHTMCLVNSSLRDKITQLMDEAKNRNFICYECRFTCTTIEEMKKHHLDYHDRTVHCAFCKTEFTGNGRSVKIIDHILTCDKHPLGIRIRELEAQGRQRDAYIIEQSNVIGKHYERITALEEEKVRGDAWERRLREIIGLPNKHDSILCWAENHMAEIDRLIKDGKSLLEDGFTEVAIGEVDS